MKLILHVSIVNDTKKGKPLHVVRPETMMGGETRNRNRTISPGGGVLALAQNPRSVRGAIDHCSTPCASGGNKVQLQQMCNTPPYTSPPLFPDVSNRLRTVRSNLEQNIPPFLQGKGCVRGMQYRHLMVRIRQIAEATMGLLTAGPRLPLLSF